MSVKTNSSGKQSNLLKFLPLSPSELQLQLQLRLQLAPRSGLFGDILLLLFQLPALAAAAFLFFNSIKVDGHFASSWPILLTALALAFMCPVFSLVYELPPLGVGFMYLFVYNSMRVEVRVGIKFIESHWKLGFP